MDFALLDVETGKTLFEKKAWFEPSYFFVLMLELNDRFGAPLAKVSSSLSEDGNTMIIGEGSYKLAFDLRTRTQIKLPSSYRQDIGRVYAFQGNDKVLGIDAGNPSNSGIYSFPDGKQLQKFKLSLATAEPVTRGNIVLTLPQKDYVIGAFDPVANKVIALSKVPALDMWDDVVATENGDGSLLLYKPLAADPKSTSITAKLPLSPLGPMKAASLSPDGRYLALSATHRSGIWDLTTGKETYMSVGFTGSATTPAGTLLLEFPKGLTEHHLTEVDNKTNKFAHSSVKLEDDEHLEAGRLLEWKADKKQISLVAHSPEDNAVQWTRSFQDRPGFTINLTDNDLIFSYAIQSSAGKEKLRADATLKDEAAQVKYKDAGRIVEIADPATGVARTQVVVEVPVSYAGAYGFNRVGDLLYLNVSDNRTIVYSMTNGAQVRQIFGVVVAADKASERVAAINRRDELIVYDRGGAELEHLKLGSAVRFAALQNDGAQLMVLTADQKVRRFDVRSKPQVAEK